MPWGRKLERALHWVFAVLAVAWLALGALGVWISMTKPAQSADLRPGELEIMVRVVQAETTGEPADGARAVAWTMLNRLREPETYGKTITRILTRPYQYAPPAPLTDNSVAFLRAMLATVQAILGVGNDPSFGATHFVRCDLKPQPVWARTFIRTAQIGQHCFFKEKR